MKRILLLTETDRDLQTHRCLEQLTLGLASDFHFEDRRICDRGLMAALGQYASLRKASAACDLVHAWGQRAMRLATLAADRPILYTPLSDDPPSAVRWLLSAMQRREVRVVALSGGEDRMCISRGVPVDSCTLVRPGIRISRTLGRDEALRAKLGFSAEHKVVLLVGESRPHADHQMGLHAVSLLAHFQPDYRLLLLGTGNQTEAITRLHDQWESNILTDARQVLGDGTSFEELISAADVGAVSAPDRVAVLPILACMASGLPLVAPATEPISEILEDHHTALLFSPRTPRLMAQRILALSDDPPLARRLSDQSRAEAYELFGVSRFLDEMRRIYGGP